MATPSTPLKLSLDTDALTLDELCLFEPDGFTATGFRKFLLAHTSWTKAEVGGLTVTDLKVVAGQLATAIQEAAVPKAN
jgi:hypothetical protein